MLGICRVGTRFLELAAVVLAAAIGSASPALAGWIEDGVPVCNAADNQQNSVIVTDRSGGAIIVWRDFRDDSIAIYAQRINAAGNVLWGLAGVLITTMETGGFGPLAVSDRVGGAYVIWNQDPSGDRIHAQRIRNDGSLLWGPGGIVVCLQNGEQYPFAAISDFGPNLMAASGVIVGWVDGRDTTMRLHMQRLNQDGTRLWGDGGAGSVGVLQLQNGESMAMTTDGTNTINAAAGAILAWHEIGANGNLDIFTNRINAAGAVQWGSGVPICAAAGDQSRPAIAKVAARSAIIAWSDQRGASYDIYAQKVVDGVAAWPTANGIPVCTAAGTQSNVRITFITGGVIVVWSSQNDNVYAQRLDLDGNLVWNPTGIPIGSGVLARFDLDVISDGAGGAFVTWRENGDIHAQRIDGDGNLLWPAGGVRVCDAPALQDDQQMLWDGSSLLFAWTDRRGGNADIYAGHLTAIGTIGIGEPELYPASALSIRMLSANPLAEGEARIAVELPRGGSLHASVFDAQGRLVRKLGDENHPAGTYHFNWDGRNESGARASTGTYFLRVMSGTRLNSVKLVRIP